VAGARVQIAGRQWTTDAAGVVTVDAPLVPATLARVEASGFRVRETRVRGGALSLFPVGPGYDDTFVDELLFGWVDLPFLKRVAAPVYLRLAAGARGARDVIEEAAAIVSRSLSNGEADYRVLDSPPAGATVFDVSVDPGAVAPGYDAYTTISLQGGRITGGTITFARLSAATALPLAIHEVGHTFGLWHITSAGLMRENVPSLTDFTSREKTVARLGWKRSAESAGEVAPDNDAAVVGSRRRTTLGVGCLL
jgi:hypothetical protein